MRKLICINHNDILTRIALIENEELTELFIECPERTRLTGSIYMGIVQKVLPGMQAVFVSIGLEKDAFLYVEDAFSLPDSTSPRPSEDDDESTLSDTEEALAPFIKTPLVDLFQPGQLIMVQITREPMEMKGARVTNHITLPGRFLVLMPTVNHTGISKRIDSDSERERLRTIVERLKPAGMGVIVRTVAEGRSEADLETDIQTLLQTWTHIDSIAHTTPAPARLYHDLDAISRVLRDIFNPTISEVIIDSEKGYEQCRSCVQSFAPELIDRIRIHQGKSPLFERFRIEHEIQKALQRKVWMPSGGYLIIDQTEAMVCIDVNTGRYVGNANLEDTVLQTNIEAAKVIARQVRLRDLSGIIVIDFIDMESNRNRERVVAALRDGFLSDRAKVNISDFSPLGLVEMTRKRLKRSLQRILMQPCPTCKGSGMAKHPQTVAFEIIKEIDQLTSSSQLNLQINLHPSIIPFLTADVTRHIETDHAAHPRIVYKPDHKLQIEQYEIVRTDG